MSTGAFHEGLREAMGEPAVPTSAMKCVRCGARFGYERCTAECDAASLDEGKTLSEQRVPRYPTQDEQDAIAWFNGLNGEDRRTWLDRAGNTGRAADAWAAYKADPSTWYPQRRCSRCDRDLVRTPSGTYVECACPPVDDLAVLRDYKHSERRVLAESGVLFETPGEDIRNALQMLTTFDPRGSDYSALDGIDKRLRSALGKLERLDELTQNPVRFVLRVANMERALAELRQQFDASTLGAYVSEVKV